MLIFLQWGHIFVKMLWHNLYPHLTGQNNVNTQGEFLVNNFRHISHMTQNILPLHIIC